MKLTQALAGVALFAGLLLPTAAHAQPVPFDTLARGVGAFGHPAGNHIIRSQAEFTNSGLDSLLPPNALIGIDWDQEMVLAVLQGGRMTGGYSIEITAVERRQLMVILPVPGPPPAWETVATVRQTSPGPFDMVTMAPTAPFHMITIPKTTDMIRFETAPTTVTFDKLTRSLSGIVQGKSIEVSANGQVTVTERTRPTVPSRTYTGTATQREIEQLQRDLASSDFHGLPNNLSTRGPQPLGGNTLTVIVEGGSLGDHRVSSHTATIRPEYRNRLAHLNDFLDRIQDRVIAGGGSAFQFDSFVRHTSGGLMPHSTSIEVKNDKSVIIESSFGFTPGPVQRKTGTATQAEFDALVSALEAAEFETMPQSPDRLPDPNPMPMDVPGVTFRLNGPVEAKVHGVAGFYTPQYAPRIRPVDQALSAIRQRIENSTQPAAFSDISRRESHVSGGHSYWTDIQVWDDARVRVQFGSNNPAALMAPPEVGQATQLELDNLRDAVTAARFHDIPRDHGSGPPGGKIRTYRVIGTPQGDRKIQGPVGGFGQHQARLDAVDAALEAIYNRMIPPPPSQVFNHLTLGTEGRRIGRWRVSKTVDIQRDGSVRVMQSHPLARYQPVDGQATQAEMDTLEDAIRNARMGSLPNPLDVIIPMHLIADPFKLEVDSPVSTHHGRTSGQLNYYGQYDARVRPLVEAIQAIESRVLGNPPPPAALFNEVNRVVTRLNTPGGIVDVGFPYAKSTTIAVAPDGEVSISRRSVGGIIPRPVPPTTGTATSAEMDALRDAIRAADFADIPDTLATVRRNDDSFTLGIESDDATVENKVTGQLHRYGTFAGRIQPIMDALDAIENRIMPPPPPPVSNIAEGTVEVRGFWGFRNVVLVGANKEFEVKPWSFARTLIKFEGHNARVRGDITDTGSGAAEVDADELLSPTRRDLQGVVRINNGTPEIESGFTGPPIRPLPGIVDPGSNPMPPPLWFPRPYTTFGPASKVLTKAEGNHVKVDAWVFDGAQREAYIVGVHATVKNDSDLTRWGNTVNKVRAGENVMLTGLSRSGNYVRVQPNSGRSGYMKTDDVQIGAVPIHGPGPRPLTAGATRAGAAGALDNSTDGDSGN